MDIEPPQEPDYCPSRTQYLAYYQEEDRDPKKLKRLRLQYLTDFYQWFAHIYEHLLFEQGEDKTYWLYNEETGVYDELNFVEVRGLVINLLTEEGFDYEATEGEVKKVLVRYRALYKERGASLDSFTPQSGWIHLNNGWLELETRKLEPHSPRRWSLFKTCTDYDLNATCPLYDKFLDKDVWMPKDQVRVLDQYSGYLLTDRIEQQVSLFFEGKKGCGKSTLVEIWMAMLGETATSMALTSLVGGQERFIGEQLKGKTLVWFDETNPRTSSINEFFQNLITGETIRIERKGVQRVENVRNTLKVIVSLNEMPDHMPTGMDRRYFHIPFTRSFTDEEVADRMLKYKILKNERSGILNRMLDGLDDLNKMQGFTLIEGEAGRRRDYTLTADDFSAFLDDHFVPSNDDEVRYNFNDMRAAFVAEYPKGYHQQLSVLGFNKKFLNTRLPEFSRLDKGKVDRNTRGYVGIKLKDGHKFPTKIEDPIVVIGRSHPDDF